MGNPDQTHQGDHHAPHYRALPDLQSAFNQLAPPPKDSGRLLFIVARTGGNTRHTPDRVTLSSAAGVPNDRWATQPDRKPDAQLSVMRCDVATLIANGQPLTTFGDNLFIDLDISAQNLPVGTRLQIGDALVEVTPLPHNGCSKFRARFGNDALHFVQAPVTRPQNLRGIYWRVVRDGDAAVGSFIRVLNRPGY
jgi:hypothetical protein